MAYINNIKYPAYPEIHQNCILKKQLLKWVPGHPFQYLLDIQVFKFCWVRA